MQFQTTAITNSSNAVFFGFGEFGQFIVTAPDTIEANEKATEATLIIKTSVVSFIANVDAKQLMPMAFLYCKSNTKDSSEIG